MGRPKHPCPCGCGGITDREYVRGHRPTRTVADRFWEKVDKLAGHRVASMASDCWLWTASLTTVGYGKFAIGKDGRRAILQDAHRVAWTLTNGEIPDGQWVLHRCDNRRCVRPDHLFLGTATDNNVDMASKGRHWLAQKTHCENGHPFDVERTVNGRRIRRCSICERAANRRAYRKQHLQPPQL
jgi:hypothetical protein